MPTVLEFLQACKSNNKVAIVEIKSNLTKEQTDMLIDIIDSEHYLPKTVFVSFKIEVLKFIRLRLPKQPVQLLSLRYKKENIAVLLENKFDIDINHCQLTKDRINKYHDHDIKVNC